MRREILSVAVLLRVQERPGGYLLSWVLRSEQYVSQYEYQVDAVQRLFRSDDGLQ